MSPLWRKLAPSCATATPRALHTDHTSRRRPTYCVYGVTENTAVPGVKPADVKQAGLTLSWMIVTVWNTSARHLVSHVQHCRKHGRSQAHMIFKGCYQRHQSPQFLGTRNFGKVYFYYVQFVQSTVLQQKYLSICYCWLLIDTVTTVKAKMCAYREEGPRILGTAPRSTQALMRLWAQPEGT